MAALQFFLLSLKDHKDAWERYLKLVRRAGLASYTELMQTAGLDERIRGEKLTLAEFARLADAFTAWKAKQA